MDKLLKQLDGEFMGSQDILENVHSSVRFQKIY